MEGEVLEGLVATCGCEILLLMNSNLGLFNSIVLTTFYILIIYNMNSWEWMTTDHNFQLISNWIVQINKVSLWIDNRLFVILG